MLPTIVCLFVFCNKRFYIPANIHRAAISAVFIFVLLVPLGNRYSFLGKSCSGVGPHTEATPRCGVIVNEYGVCFTTLLLRSGQSYRVTGLWPTEDTAKAAPAERAKPRQRY